MKYIESFWISLQALLKKALFFPPQNQKFPKEVLQKLFWVVTQFHFVCLFCLCYLLSAVIIVQISNTPLAGVYFQFQEVKLFHLSCLKAKIKSLNSLTKNCFLLRQLPLLSFPDRNTGIGTVIHLIKQWTLVFMSAGKNKRAFFFFLLITIWINFICQKSSPVIKSQE